MSEARPIETAPKDGSPVLIYGDCRLVGYTPEKFDRLWHVGKWETSYWSDGMDGWIVGATHWLPFPDVPPEARE